MIKGGESSAEGTEHNQFNLNKIFDTAKKVTETASKLSDANKDISQEDEIAMVRNVGSPCASPSLSKMNFSSNFCLLSSTSIVSMMQGARTS